MENQEINYARFKESFSDKVIKQNNEWVVKRTWKVKGYDSLLSEWVNIPSKSRTKILPVSEAGLSKSITQTLIIKRSALDSMLRSVSVFLKLTRKIEVLDKSNNIFVKISNDRAWQTDLTTTCMVPMNHVPAGLKITVLKEEKLSTEEMHKLESDLSNSKLLIKPILVDQLQNNEYRLIVS